MNIVLCLRQHIGGQNARVGAVVRDSENLARTGEGINADPTKNLAFRFINEGVAWPNDFVHRRNALRSPGHSRNGLRAANFENAVRACQMANCNHHRMGARGRQAIICSQPATVAGTIDITGAERIGYRPPGT